MILDSVTNSYRSEPMESQVYYSKKKPWLLANLQSNDYQIWMYHTGNNSEVTVEIEIYKQEYAIQFLLATE